MTQLDLGTSPLANPAPFSRVVAVAASTGGLKALSTILSGLPSDFGAPMIVVQHLSPSYPSQMAAILSRRTSLHVKQAEEGDRLYSGVVYLAPPKHHLLVNQAGLYLSDAERVHFTRPAADPLFESVAQQFRQQAIAVVLTGGNGDGAWGAQVIKQMGGKVIAQDQATSEHFGMPSAAIQTGVVDWILPIEAIAPKLITLITTGAM
ncbi:Chemotaxis response regulator protein-glutamate methylesterase CheB [uncultured Synechococcales cyanobacterium]|uniref:protein-glutamate methylesterase n=1 Tax=uncultured Synechococcales cyanobacterium TaxID=1936017 RepID=A0A6J4UHL7_9CYAN|nr:Chemotaxis response regulator protein-glutamate methylesterase CheB [uncultured Synechococcales cyanobacterium]